MLRIGKEEVRPAKVPSMAAANLAPYIRKKSGEIWKLQNHQKHDSNWLQIKNQARIQNLHIELRVFKLFPDLLFSVQKFEKSWPLLRPPASSDRFETVLKLVTEPVNSL